MGVIVAVENSFEEEGTIPKPSENDAFADRCVEIVRRSRGTRVWVIGNEPNDVHSRPKGETITPELFAKCYNICRRAIRGVAGHENDWVIPGPVGPFINDTQYVGNSTGDWVRYFSDLLSYILMQRTADAIALHTFSFSQESSVISQEEKFPAPFDQNHRGFRAYRDFLKCHSYGTSRVASSYYRNTH